MAVEYQNHNIACAVFIGRRNLAQIRIIGARHEYARSGVDAVRTVRV